MPTIPDTEVWTNKEVITLLKVYSDRLCNKCAQTTATCIMHSCFVPVFKKAAEIIERQDAALEEKTAKLKQMVPATTDIKVNVVQAFADLIKLEFYKQFDEIVPPIMSDRIDEIAQEVLGNISLTNQENGGKI